MNGTGMFFAIYDKQNVIIWFIQRNCYETTELATEFWQSGSVAMDNGMMETRHNPSLA